MKSEVSRPECKLRYRNLTTKWVMSEDLTKTENFADQRRAQRQRRPRRKTQSKSKKGNTTTRQHRHRRRRHYDGGPSLKSTDENKRRRPSDYESRLRKMRLGTPAPVSRALSRYAEKAVLVILTLLSVAHGGSCE